MGRTANNDPYKYSNRVSIDGRLPGDGEVLVPVRLPHKYKISKENRKYITTCHYGDFKFQVGFMPIPIKEFQSYMAEFTAEINKLMDWYRLGRCIIGYKPNGEPICCPKANLCTGCSEKYEHDRYNPRRERYQLISLDYYSLDDCFRIEDTKALNPEEYVLSQEAGRMDPTYDYVISHFERTNPRYATIIRLCKHRVPAEEIFRELGVKPSRGYQEINNAYDAICKLLNTPIYKKTRSHK